MTFPISLCSSPARRTSGWVRAWTSPPRCGRPHRSQRRPRAPRSRSSRHNSSSRRLARTSSSALHVKHAAGRSPGGGTTDHGPADDPRRRRSRAATPPIRSAERDPSMPGIDDLIASIEVEKEAAEKRYSKTLKETELILAKAQHEGRSHLTEEEGERIEELKELRERTKADIEGAKRKLADANDVKAEEMERDEQSRKIEPTKASTRAGGRT